MEVIAQGHVYGRVVLALLAGINGGEGSAGTCPIPHAHGNAHIVHQRGHRLYLCLARRGRQLIRHALPVEYGVGEGGRQRGAVPHVALAAAALPWPVPVFHHLRHGGGHAACYAMRAAYLGAEQVVCGSTVGAQLVPRGGQQRAYRGSHVGRGLCAWLLQFGPFGLHLGTEACALLTVEADLVVIFPQPCFDMLRQVLLRQ